MEERHDPAATDRDLPEPHPADEQEARRLHEADDPRGHPGALEELPVDEDPAGQTDG